MNGAVAQFRRSSRKSVTFGRTCSGDCALRPGMWQRGSNAQARWYELHMALRYLHTPCSEKKQRTWFSVITSANVDRFSMFFTGRFSSKLCKYLSWRLQSHLNYVAALPCKILKFKTIWHLWLLLFLQMLISCYIKISANVLELTCLWNNLQMLMLNL